MLRAFLSLMTMCALLSASNAVHGQGPPFGQRGQGMGAQGRAFGQGMAAQGRGMGAQGGKGIGQAVSALAKSGVHGQQLAAQVKALQAAKGIGAVNGQGKGMGQRMGARPRGNGPNEDALERLFEQRREMLEWQAEQLREAAKRARDR